MANQNDGGSAFPVAFEETNEHGVKFPYVERGMSRRDWFAGQALPALIARHRADVPWREIAPIAYKIADALIVEGEKTEG